MTSLTTRGLRSALLSFFTSALANFERHAHAFTLVCTVPDASPTLPVPAPRARTPAERLIILDSSFNPPTVAHMRMVLSAVESYYDPASAGVVDGSSAARGSARILLLLSVQNADKAPRPASFPQRLVMMYLFAKELRRKLPQGPEVDVALASQPYFHSKCELIARAEGHYAAPGEMEQVFLVGYDTLIRVFNPKYYGEGGSMEEVLGPFFGKARLRVALRTGDGWGEEEEQRGYLRGLGKGGLEKVGGRGEWVERVELVGMGEREVVSSSLVREAARRGDGVALGRLLGEEVREWVLAEGLYQEDE